MKDMIRTLTLVGLVAALSTSITGCERFWKFLHHHDHDHGGAGTGGGMDAACVDEEDAGTIDEDASVDEDGGGGSAAICGGLLGLECDDDEYCNFPIAAMCGAADQTGTCADIPELCTLEFAPVCGCNGITYTNACKAAAAGVSVAALGECSPL